MILQHLRQDVAASCDLGHADAERAHADAAELGGKIDDVRAAVAANAPPDSAPVTDAVDAAGGALHSDVWFLIGLAACCLPAYALYRQAMPRA